MNRSLACLLVVMATLATSAPAEQAAGFGDYTVHYNAFTTDILTPEVAKAYRIQRSKNRALLNVSVLKKVMGTTATPVPADIKGTATNLSAQLRELEIRELADQGAIYYIAETPVNNGETLRYDLTVTPRGESEPIKISFEQQFYTE